MITPMDAAGRDGIVSALRVASAETGADFGYLMRTAMRESSLNPNAKAATSSATGLFQFIEQTWLGVVKRHGAEHGLGAYGEAIEETGTGRFRVADKALRREILALRSDPELAARMAGELTAENRAILERRIGRDATAGELYAAHFLGPSQAARLISAAQATPDESAADLFPDAAAANKPIFYGEDGAARTLQQVYARLTVLPGGDVAPDQPAPAVAPPLLLAGVSGSTFASGATPPPASASGGPGAWSRAPLVMTPQVIEILAALDPAPARTDEQARARDGRDDRWRFV